MSGSYLVDVLALELGEELLETFVISFDTDGAEDSLDVFGAGAVVATEAEKEVCCETVGLVSECSGESLVEPRHTASF
jgi:hypothetical protein